MMQQEVDFYSLLQQSADLSCRNVGFDQCSQLHRAMLTKYINEKLYVGKYMTNFFAFKSLPQDEVSNVRKEAEISVCNIAVTFS